MAFKFPCVGKTGDLDFGERGGGIVWNPKLGVEDSDAKAGCGGSVVAGGKDPKMLCIWLGCVRDLPLGRVN